MFKNILTSLLLILIFIFGNINTVSAETNIGTNDNILIKAFKKRKQKLYDAINGGKITREIRKIKLDLKSLESNKKLNKEVKSKLIVGIKKIENEIKENKDKLNKKELEKFLKNSQEAIELKNNLIKRLDNEIENNKINVEKNKILLKRLSKAEEKENSKKVNETTKKYIIFIVFTSLLIFGHLILIFLLKNNKIRKSRGAYARFFLIFSYTIFLIWFFFYLYPELSVFIIFVSGYILAINANLIASFVGSIIVLEKYKIGDFIRFGEFRGQIIEITTLNVVLLSITEEGIFYNKPVVIPNFKLLKEEVIKDINPERIIYHYELKFAVDLQLDTLKLVENIEQEVLMKHLRCRLNTLKGNEESFRTALGFDTLGKIKITFTWKGDDTLNKRIGRKIMGLFSKTVELKRNELELKEKNRRLAEMRQVNHINKKSNKKDKTNKNIKTDNSKNNNLKGNSDSKNNNFKEDINLRKEIVLDTMSNSNKELDY